MKHLIQNILIVTLTILFFNFCNRHEKVDNIPVKALSGIKLGKGENIYIESFIIENDSLLIGNWLLDKEWGYFHDYWGAMRPLEDKIEYRFTSTRKFQRIIYNKDGIIKNKISGEFVIDTSFQRIIFAYNDKNDTIFELGDTAHVFKQKVHLLNDTVLRIDEHASYASDKYFNIGEYKLIK